MKNYKMLGIALLAIPMISLSNTAISDDSDDDDIANREMPLAQESGTPLTTIVTSGYGSSTGITVCHVSTISQDPKSDITTPGGDAPAGATGLPIPPLPKDPGGSKWRHGFDDSQFKHNWTHGDPNKYLPDHNGYYYLDITATGTTLIGTVQVTKREVQSNGTSGVALPDPTTDGIGYRLDFSPDLDHLDRKRVFLGCTNEHGYAELRWTGAVVGHHYRFRLANRYNSGLTDHATFRSE